MLKKTSCGQALTNKILLRLVLAAFLYGLLSWFLALGFDSATYYAHPWYFNYGALSSFCRLLGYNDHPHQSLFTGFDRALSLVGIVIVLGCVRELIIHYVEKPGKNRPYRDIGAQSAHTGGGSVLDRDGGDTRVQYLFRRCFPDHLCGLYSSLPSWCLW